MKQFQVIIACILLQTACNEKEGVQFDKFFDNGTLRIDYIHNGNATSESVTMDGTYKYPEWAGSLKNLLDTLDYGAYYYKVYDPVSGMLIYSKGFDSYFKEYQLTTAAINGERKSYHESAILPLPKKKITFALEKRSKEGVLQEIFRTEIDPETAQNAAVDAEVQVFSSLNNGNPNIKADILIVGEGYTKEEEQKFRDDLHRFTDIFFRAEPCRSYRDRFNIRGVLKPSEDSGVDEPRAGIDKKTAVNATFNSLGSERYLLTEDNKALRDIAGHAPYDALYIMVNSARYGGGGIYNFYCVYTSDNVNSAYLMVHEFGHSFFGLADEYYTSSTAYSDFYPAGYEPNEANITALKDPDHIKWKHLVSEGIEIPTPWNKAEFDSIDNAWQKQRAELNDQIASLKRNGAPVEKIREAEELYNRESIARQQAVDDFLDNSPLAGKVGAFEGAGYASTGLYRPSLNCIMFSRTDYFCNVCQDAMVKIIEFYSE